jgi:hypothetical protein
MDVDLLGRSRVSFPGPRHELGNAVGGEAVDHLLEHVLEIGVRFDAVQFARFDERADRCPTSAAAVGASEQMILAPEGDRTDRALDGVRVELDAAILEEASQRRPVSQSVPDRIREWAALWDQHQLLIEPGLEVFDERSGFGAADFTPFIGRLPPDLLLDAIELTDSTQRFGGDRRCGGLSDFLELASRVRPAGGESDVSRTRQLFEASIAVDLQNAWSRTSTSCVNCVEVFALCHIQQRTPSNSICVPRPQP